MYKDIIRLKYKKIRKKVDKNKSDFVIEKLFESKEYKNSNVIFTYVSYNDELNTVSFIKKALDEKTVLVPYCIPGTNDMIPVKISSLDDLKKGSFNILEPENPIEYKEKIDLTIVPGIVFSKDGHRLGYGKGFYDKFLHKNKTKTIGLTFDELLVDSLPYNDFDVTVDKIITPGKEIEVI